MKRRLTANRLALYISRLVALACLLMLLIMI